MDSLLGMSRGLLWGSGNTASLISRLGWKGLEGPHSPSGALHVVFAEVLGCSCCCDFAA